MVPKPSWDAEFQLCSACRQTGRSGPECPNILPGPLLQAYPAAAAAAAATSPVSRLLTGSVPPRCCSELLAFSARGNHQVNMQSAPCSSCPLCICTRQCMGTGHDCRSCLDMMCQSVKQSCIEIIGVPAPGSQQLPYDKLKPCAGQLWSCSTLQMSTQHCHRAAPSSSLLSSTVETTSSQHVSLTFFFLGFFKPARPGVLQMFSVL